MFSRYFVIFMLVLAIILVACGGEEESEEAGQAAEPATAEPATPTVEPATATPEPPPTPTLAPTPTEVAEEATTEAEDDSDGAAVGAGWGASESGSQSACDHPYLPLRPGATWTYELSDGSVIWEVVDVQGNMDEATTMLNVTVGDVILDYQWHCTAGQGLDTFDFANLTSAPVGLDMTIEQVSIDGQFILPPDQMIPGASWTAELLGEISYSQEVEGTSIEATGEMKTVQEHTIKSAEPVEFDGQTVPGLQIEQVNTITLLLSLMGTNTEQTISLTNDYDLGYGIGIIGQSSESNFGTDTMELVSYSIP